MATVSELIEYLMTLPSDAIVKCGEESSRSYYTEVIMVPVDINSTDIFDYSSKEDQERYPLMDGKIFVHLHGE